VRFVWKHFPLESLHPDAPAAHLASVAAQKQGKFWEFHDRLFTNQRNLKMDAFLQYARELGLDMERFQSDLTDLANKAPVDADTREARSMGLTGTPAFFVNGRFLRGAQPFSEFARVIDAELERLNRPLPESRRGP
jgi:protein-disulfide isomerase